MFLAKQHW